MLSIGISTSALNAQASASSVLRDMETSMQRLSTGKRINAARDDSAGAAISSRMSSEIRGTEQAIRNTLDAQALVDTAEGGLVEVENILQRMRELAVQASNDTNSSVDRKALDEEYQQFDTEINHIFASTKWAGNSLLDGTGGLNGTFEFQVGSSTRSANTVSHNFNSPLSTSLQNVAVSDVTVNTTIVPNSNNNFYYDLTFNGPLKDGMIVSYDISADTSQGHWARLTTLGNFNELYFPHDGNTGSFTMSVDSSGNITALSNITGNHYFDIMYNAHLSGQPLHHTGNAGVSRQSNTTVRIINGYQAGGFTLSNITVSEQANATDVSVSDVKTRTAARSALSTIDTALQSINNKRASLGALSNGLDHTISNLTNMSGNLSKGKGRIEDADFTNESTRLAVYQILNQASTAMLAEANASKQNVLSLLQG